MTLTELLEELKQVDPETYRKWFNDYDVLGLDQWQLDSLQDCIQRACERRGWEIEQNYRTRGRDGDLPKNMRHYAVVTSWDNDVHTYHGMGNSATKALLAAYIAAVKEEERKDTPVLVDHPMYDGHGKGIPRHSTVFSDICEGEKR